MLADDIFCLDDGPRVLDCLEFDDHLRYVDGLDDIAFLAMDLEHLGAAGSADRLLDRYAEFTGDPAPASLREHFMAYRAFVRAKVSYLRVDQGDPQARQSARDYAEQALAHLRKGRVRLILVGGLPGSGKSTVSDIVGRTLAAVVLSSDQVREEMVRVPNATDGGYGVGRYSPENIDVVYSEILCRAVALLSMGETVVLDASWTHATHRAAAARTAGHTSSRLASVECILADDLAAQRIRKRRGSLSEATPAIASAIRQAKDPWPEAISLPTAGDVEDVADRVRRLISAHGSDPTCATR